MSQMMKYRFWTGTEKDRETGETIPVDWVEYKQIRNADGMVPSLATQDKVRRLDPDRVKLPEGADGGFKLAHMRTIWNDMLPEYEAWKEGKEVPDTGTPLAVWTQLTHEDAEVLRQSGIRTVEEVAGLNDNSVSRIRLPNIHDLRKLAKMFLDNRQAEVATAKEQALMDTIAALTARIDQITANPAPLPNQDDVDEVEALRAELDAREIVYDRRWGAKRLREALNGEEPAAA